MKLLFTIVTLATLNLNILADGLSGSFALTNNYIVRGTAQNYSQDPVLMANLNYDYHNFYIGFFTANVDFQEDRLGLQKSPTNRELSTWIGYRFNLGTLNVDSMFGSYNYTGDTFTSLDMIEAKVCLSKTINKFTISASCGYTPDYFNVLGESVWADVALSYQLSDKLSFSAGLGRQFIPNKGGSDVMPLNPDGYSYTTWNAGLTYTIDKNWSVDVHYYNTDRRDLGKIYTNNPYDSNISAALKFSF